MPRIRISFTSWIAYRARQTFTCPPARLSQPTVRAATWSTHLLHPVCLRLSLRRADTQAAVPPSAPGEQSTTIMHRYPVAPMVAVSPPTRPSIREDCRLPTRVSPPRRDCASLVAVPPRTLQPSSWLSQVDSVLPLGLALLSESRAAVSVFHHANGLPS